MKSRMKMILHCLCKSKSFLWKLKFWNIFRKLLQANFYYMEKDGNLMLSVGEKMFFVNKEVKFGACQEFG